jgi:thioredoxin 2
MTTQASTAPRITVRCTQCGTWNRVRADRATSGPKCGSCSAPIALDHPVLLDDASFDRVLAETDLPVFVDFYADWCGPCQMMAPAVDALATEMVGRALIAKLDTDRSQQVAGRFQIRGIPTSMVFRNGREVKRQTGALPLHALRALLV